MQKIRSKGAGTKKTKASLKHVSTNTRNYSDGVHIVLTNSDMVTSTNSVPTRESDCRKVSRASAI